MYVFQGEARNIDEYKACIDCFMKTAPSAAITVTEEFAKQNKLQVFFRGHKSNKFEWTPSVFRGYLTREADIYHRCIQQFPAEFYGLNSIFDRLAKIQHYGGATRILDFTIDPLFALWVACDTSNEGATNDGEIAIYRTTYSDEFELGVRCLSFLATYSDEINDCFFDKLRDHLKENHSNELLQNLMKQHYFVVPQITNERLRRQKGAFLIFGQDNSTLKKVSDLEYNTGRGDGVPGYIGYISIPLETKMKIKKALSRQGYTERQLFPKIEREFKKIKEDRP